MTSFVLRSIVILIIYAFCASMLVAVADSKDATSNNECYFYYRNHYLTREPHKAIATSGGRALCSGNTSFGFSTGRGTKQDAIGIALEECRQAAKRVKRTEACKIIDAK
jgi:hypothetical protein